MKIKYFLIFISTFIVLIKSNCYSQLQQKAVIPSLSNNYSNLQSPENIGTVYTSPVDIQAMRENASALADSTEEDYYGQLIPFNIDVLQNATKETLSNGDGFLYRLKIAVKNALGLQFQFDDFHIPTGGQLFFYDTNHKEKIGAFTEANNRSFRTFATTIVRNDTIIIEYKEPLNAIGSTLHLSNVVVCFSSNLQTTVGGDDQSAPCEINVACAAGDTWVDERAGVALILYNSGGGMASRCTGTLINNTDQDGTPYFLSAGHCIKGVAPGADYTNWIFMFHHEASTCSAPAFTAPTNYSLNGAAKLTSAIFPNSSDYLLLELFDKPGADMALCYAGWDISPVTPSSPVTALHHPRGDAMKITISSTPVEDNYTGSANYFHIPEFLVEAGSSGSPLFDQNHHLIAQLYGTTVGTANNSLCDPTTVDAIYGKFSVSFNNGNFKNWLAPGNTNTTLSLGNYCPYKTIAGGGGSGGGGGGDGGGSGGGGGTGGYGGGYGGPVGNSGTLCASKYFDNGFSINGQQNDAVAYICDINPMTISCVYFPWEVSSEESCPWYKSIFGCNDVFDWKFFTSFYECNDDLSITGHNEIVHNESIRRNNDEYPPAYMYNIGSYASRAGVSLSSGKFYRFKLGGTYENDSKGYAEYTRYFYIIPNDLVLNNRNLSSLQFFGTAKHIGRTSVTIQNTTISAGQSVEIIAGSYIEMLPGTEISGDFTARIHSVDCDAPQNSRLASITPNIIEIPLPSNFYSKASSKNKTLDIIGMQVIPNPSNGIFKINLPNLNFYDITIYNFLGSIVYKNRVAGGSEINLDIAELPQGMYTIKAENLNGKYFVEKVVKQN